MPRWLKIVLVAIGGVWLFIAAFGFLILKLF